MSMRSGSEVFQRYPADNVGRRCAYGISKSDSAGISSGSVSVPGGRRFLSCQLQFEFFPGVPLYHSRNLADWELLGYCLNTEEQLNLKEAHASGGIYAPTIPVA